jgi:hypothetical protein
MRGLTQCERKLERCIDLEVRDQVEVMAEGWTRRAKAMHALAEHCIDLEVRDQVAE